jgi:hypothetical protein
MAISCRTYRQSFCSSAVVLECRPAAAAVRSSQMGGVWQGRISDHYRRQQMTKLKVSILALLTLLALSAPRAEATTLVPGDTVVAATNPTGFGGTLLASFFYDNQVVTDATGTVKYTVDLATAVYRNASGTLDFYYQVTDVSGPNSVRRFSMVDFTGFATDVFQIEFGSTVACSACPGGFFLDGTQTAATTDRGAGGDVVGWNFIPAGATALNPGETSFLFVIRTDATVFVPGSMSTIDGATLDRLAFAPGVPEPASLTLLGLGFLSTGLVARRRQKQQKSA